MHQGHDQSGPTDTANRGCSEAAEQGPGTEAGAEQGMAEVSKLYKEKGNELYLPAAEAADPAE